MNALHLEFSIPYDLRAKYESAWFSGFDAKCAGLPVYANPYPFDGGNYENYTPSIQWLDGYVHGRTGISQGNGGYSRILELEGGRKRP